MMINSECFVHRNLIVGSRSVSVVDQIDQLMFPTSKTIKSSASFRNSQGNFNANVISCFIWWLLACGRSNCEFHGEARPRTTDSSRSAERFSIHRRTPWLYLCVRGAVSHRVSRNTRGRSTQSLIRRSNWCRDDCQLTLSASARVRINRESISKDSRWMPVHRHRQTRRRGIQLAIVFYNCLNAASGQHGMSERSVERGVDS
jgi:hypothetical protein